MCLTRKVVFEQKKSILFVNIKKWKRQNLPTRLLKVSVNQKVDLITCETHYSWFQKPQTFIAEAAFTASLKHKNYQQIINQTRKQTDKVHANNFFQFFIFDYHSKYLVLAVTHFSIHVPLNLNTFASCLTRRHLPAFFLSCTEHTF